MVKSYVNSCMNCTHNKAPHHKPYGKLKQLPIPNKLWNSISMDFIEHLLAANGFTTILVIVNCLTKQSLFIPTYNTINSPQLTQLFLTHVLSQSMPCIRGLTLSLVMYCGSDTKSSTVTNSGLNYFVCCLFLR